MTLEKMSRPSWSVPKGCSQLGPANARPRAASAGSAGAMNGASAPVKTSASRKSPPIPAARWRANRRQKGAASRPRRTTGTRVKGSAWLMCA